MFGTFSSKATFSAFLSERADKIFYSNSWAWASEIICDSGTSEDAMEVDGCGSTLIFFVELAIVALLLIICSERIYFVFLPIGVKM